MGQFVSIATLFCLAKKQGQRHCYYCMKHTRMYASVYAWVAVQAGRGA